VYSVVYIYVKSTEEQRYRCVARYMSTQGRIFIFACTGCILSDSGERWSTLGVYKRRQTASNAGRQL